jgi:hypothetical protein
MRRRWQTNEPGGVSHNEMTNKLLSKRIQQPAPSPTVRKALDVGGALNRLAADVAIECNDAPATEKKWGAPSALP